MLIIQEIIIIGYLRKQRDKRDSRGITKFMNENPMCGNLVAIKTKKQTS
jgi:hypothetical protein